MQVVNKDTRRVEIIKDEEFDEEKLSEAVNDFCIAGWFLKDKEGNEVPCTRDNKLLLMGKMPRFARWINKCLTELREATEKEAEAERKNL